MAEAKARSRGSAATSGRSTAKSRRGVTATEVTSQKERLSDAGTSAQDCPVAFCPVGLALSVMRNAKPEVMGHLQAAAREFLLAAKAVVDTRVSDLDDGEEPAKLERIEIK
ncbi:MAG TPA: hypothetical protein VF382_02840 [Actinomycetota bacterium]|jgi:hypothetical protein